MEGGGCGAFGGILAGYISDRFSAKVLTAAGFICLSILALVLYGTCGTYFPDDEHTIDDCH